MMCDTPDALSSPRENKINKSHPYPQGWWWDVRALVVLEERPAGVSLEALLEERGLLPYVRAGLMVVLVNGRAVRPSELAFQVISPEDKVVVVPVARGG